MIGGQYTNGDEISGMVVSIRKQQNRIAMWTKTSDEQERIMSLG
jgi:ribosomal protein S1